MRKSMGSWFLAIALGVITASGSGWGAEKRAHRYTVGVFLPTTMTDGQARFDYAEALAAKLTESLGQPVSGRSFARYEDFAKAAANGTLDLGVVDAWAAAEAPNTYEPIALASVGGETYERWAVIGRSHKPVIDYKGKRLAMTKGIGALGGKFVTNVIFAGDLVAQRHFRLVSVPSVESAMKMIEVKSAECALVPLMNVPKGTPVLYRSNRFPIAVVVAIKAKPDGLADAIKAVGNLGPFDKFVDATPEDVGNLRKLINSGPPKRTPIIAESPVLRMDPNSLLEVSDLGLSLPSFVETMEVSAETPDD